MSLSRGFVRVTSVLTIALLGAVSWGATVIAQATPTAGAAEQYTPVLQSVPSPPRWFEGSDGRVHLVYELFLANAFPVPVSVTTVEVLDAGSEATIATLEGAALTAAMSTLTAPATSTTELSPSTLGVVWFDLPFAGPDDLPAAVAHRITTTVPPELPVPGSIAFIGDAVDVDLRPPVVLGPPLLGPGWAGVGSCCDGPHRRAFQPINGGLYLAQRFAIDFNRLDAEDRLVAGDPSLNESYPSFGQPVIAVADGTVVAAVDQFPDQVPNAPTGVTLESANGNHVIIDLGDGRYAFYAHLRAGSVTVRAGDVVRRGDGLGALGNSGSSTGPHLHFHVMSAPSALVADGMPYVFDEFDLVGETPPIPELIALSENGTPVPLDTVETGPRLDALPLGRTVVDFPDHPAEE